MKKINWKAIIGWTVGVALFLGIIGYNAYQNEKKSEHTFIIHALAPLSGPFSVYAKEYKKAFDLAQKEIDTKYGAGKIKIEMEDSQGNPTTAVNIYQQKIKGNKNRAMILLYSATAKALEPLMDGTMVSSVVAATLPGIAKPEKHLYQITLTLKDMLASIHKYIEKKNIKTASVVYINDDYGVEGLRQFKAGFKALGGKIIDEIPYDVTERDVRLQILKAFEHNPEMFWVIGYGSNSYNILNQLVSLDYKGLIMTDYSYAWPGFYKMNPELAKYILTVSPVETEDFQKKYKPLGMDVIGGAPILDSALVIAEAYMKCQGDVAKMDDYIMNLKDYNGAYGIWSMRPTGDIYLPTQVMRWGDGELVPVEN